MTDFLGKIGKIRFVTGKVAFQKAAKAQKEGRFAGVKPKEKTVPVKRQQAVSK